LFGSHELVCGASSAFAESSENSKWKLMRNNERAFDIDLIIGSPAAFIFAHKRGSADDFPPRGRFNSVSAAK
jgi:hypothetical protein